MNEVNWNLDSVSVQIWVGSARFSIYLKCMNENPREARIFFWIEMFTFKNALKNRIVLINLPHSWSFGISVSFMTFRFNLPRSCHQISVYLVHATRFQFTSFMSPDFNLPRSCHQISVYLVHTIQISIYLVHAIQISIYLVHAIQISIYLIHTIQISI